MKGVGFFPTEPTMVNREKKMDNATAVAAAESHITVKRARTSNLGGVGTTPNSVAEIPMGDASQSLPTPRLPHNNGLEDLADKYTLGRILGRGSYG